MLSLAIKDLPFTGACLLAIVGGWITYLIDRGGGELHPQASYMMGFFLLIGVCGAAFAREMSAMQERSYAFLRTLPVSDRDIMAARFLLSLLDTCFCWFATMVVFSLFASSAGDFALHAVYLGLWGSIGLILSALWHIGVHGIGIGKAGIALGVVLMGCFLPAALVLDKMFEFRETRGFPPAVFVLASMHWIVWVMLACVILAVHYALMRIAIKVKESSELYL